MVRHPRVRRPGQPGVRDTQHLLNALSALYQLLRTPRPIDDLLQAILDTALRFVPGAQRGSLLVLGDAHLCYRAVVGYDLEQLRAVRFPADLTFSAFLGNDRSAQIYDYTAWDALNLDAATVALLREYGHIDAIRSSLITSILVGERVYGALVLDNLRSHAPFPARARSLAQLLADQAGTLLEQAELLEQVRQANSQLQEAERLATLGRFIAGIAHEINNPLTAVLGYADLLALKGLDAEGQDLLVQLRAGAERVRGTVRNLQLFARQQRNDTTLVDLNGLIEQAMTLKRSELKGDQISVQYERAEELSLIGADGGALSQLLLQLIGNAQYALRDQPVPRQIVIRSQALLQDPDPLIRVSIADNGPGVPAVVRNRIFEPFFSTKPAAAGAGLGLSICRKIAADHGGKLWLEPTTSGATFVLELPLARTVDATSSPAGAQLHSSAVEQPRRTGVMPQGLLVLVVDDDPAVATLIRRALSGSNRISVAGDGLAALEQCALEPFDVILCDLKMPVLSGPEFYQRLLVRHPQLAANLIFISGDTTSPETQTFLKACGRPILNKPFSTAELHGVILGGKG
jgi:signal transduction histidine kinase/CheY-like chemotaxis protein